MARSVAWIVTPIFMGRVGLPVVPLPSLYPLATRRVDPGERPHPAAERGDGYRARAMGSLDGRLDDGSTPGAGQGSPGARSDVATLLGLVVLAAVVRVGALLRTDVIFNDGPIFLGIAEEMAAGEWHAALAHDQHPGYPLLVRVAMIGAADSFDAAVGVSLVFGTGAVLALHAFLRRAWDRRVAAVGAVLLALNPYAARFSADVQTEPVYLFFFLLAVTAVFAALRGGDARLAVGAGLLSGLAYSVRPEGLGVAGVGGLLAGVAWIRGSWTGGRTARWLGALAAGAGVLVLPYVLFVRSVSGSFRLSQKKSLLTILGVDPVELDEIAGGAFLPSIELLGAVVVIGALWLVGARLRGTAAVRVRVGATALAAVVAGAVAAAAALAPGSLGTFLAVYVSTIRPEVALLGLVGIVGGVSRPPSGRTLFVALLVGSYSALLFGLLLTYGYVSRRHALPPLTLLLGYAGAGAWVLIDGLAARLAEAGVPGDRARRGAVVAVVAALALIALPKAWHDHRAEERAARTAAEWLRENTEGEGALASSRLKHGWYAGRRWLPLRQGDHPKSLQQLHAEGVRFVLVDSRSGPAPGTWSTEPVDPAAVVPVERHTTRDGSESAVVYELVVPSR
jgi:4-amino-4-deoxy-L-arabinose transferase-like glycosyltransferase